MKISLKKKIQDQFLGETCRAGLRITKKQTKQELFSLVDMCLAMISVLVRLDRNPNKIRYNLNQIITQYNMSHINIKFLKPHRLFHP